jgi:O-antigen/teichoic acid export membrane protein
LPSFAAKAGDNEAQLGALKTIVATAATVVFPLFWFAGVMSHVAFPLIFGPRWNALVFPFTAFTLLLPLRTVYALLGSAVVGTGNTSTTFKNMIAWALIMTPILLLGAAFGPRTVAVAWVVGFPLVFLSAMRRISRSFRITLSELLRPLFMPAICAAASAAVVGVLALILEPLLKSLVLLTIQIVLAGGLYWVLMVRFGRSQYDQVVQLVRQVLGR